MVSEGPWGPRYFRDLFLVAADGGGVSLETRSGTMSESAVAFPLPGSSDPLVLPDLAPGTWRLVRPERTYTELVALFDGHGHVLPALAVFTVHLGATARVEVPVGEAEQADRVGKSEH